MALSPLPPPPSPPLPPPLAPQKAADADALGQPLFKTLNAGLALAAAGHLAVLGPMYMANQVDRWAKKQPFFLASLTPAGSQSSFWHGV